MQETSVRPLRIIAGDIRTSWKTLNTAGYAAKPYVDAMAELDSINDQYFMDSARSIVQYFLGNATSWRGVEARRIKAELKALLALPRG